jgi:hypothetical protein
MTEVQVFLREQRTFMLRTQHTSTEIRKALAGGGGDSFVVLLAMDDNGKELSTAIRTSTIMAFTVREVT